MADMNSRKQQYSSLKKGLLIYEYVIEKGVTTAKQAAIVAGCSRSRAYEILDELAEFYGWYKEGPFYIAPDDDDC